MYVITYNIIKHIPLRQVQKAAGIYFLVETLNQEVSTGEESFFPFQGILEWGRKEEREEFRKTGITDRLI